MARIAFITVSNILGEMVRMAMLAFKTTETETALLVFLLPPFIDLSVSLSLCQSLGVSVSLRVSVSPCLCVSVSLCLSGYLSVSQSLSLSFVLIHLDCVKRKVYKHTNLLTKTLLTRQFWSTKGRGRKKRGRRKEYVSKRVNE